MTDPTGQIAAGGADTKFSENVDLANPKDAGLVRQLMRRRPRWSMSEADRDRFTRNAIAAQDKAFVDDNLAAFAAVGRLIVTMEAQNQTDELDAKKDARLDAGLSTENVSVFTVKPPRVIGTPESANSSKASTMPQDASGSGGYPVLGSGV